MIDNLLYTGTYLFVDAPKVGKSFFMAQLAFYVSKGFPMWRYHVHQGDVLYLALEDDYPRLQQRLTRMFGAEENNRLHFAIQSKQLHNGLEIGDAKPQKPMSLGKYGRMRLIYLRDFNSEVYNEFLRTGELQKHLIELNDTAFVRLNCIVDQIMKQDGVTKQLKATDQMRWVQKMNQIRSAADEIVHKELVYA